MTLPLDMGSLLRRALSLHNASLPPGAAPMTQASLSRLTGLAPPNLSRALRSPDTRPPVARRILSALHCRLEVRGPEGGIGEAAPEPGRDSGK